MPSEPPNNDKDDDTAPTDDDARKALKDLSSALTDGTRNVMTAWLKQYMKTTGPLINGEITKLFEKNSAGNLLKPGLMPSQEIQDQMTNMTTEFMKNFERLVDGALDIKKNDDPEEGPEQ